MTGLTISLAAVPGLAARFAPADFTIASNSCGSTLVGGTSCTVGIQFSPTVTGLRAAALTATDIGGDSSAIYLAWEYHQRPDHPAADAAAGLFARKYL